MAKNRKKQLKAARRKWAKKVHFLYWLQNVVFYDVGGEDER